MIINHNITALNTHRQLSSNTAATSKNIEKLSSGLRINRAGDDAAGLAISEKMRGQIRGLDMASKNAQDGISLIQTAEGALNETHSILQRVRELAVQSSSDTNTESDRKELQKEVQQLKDEVDRIANNTEFNTKKLLNGDLSAKTYKDESAIVASKTGDFDVKITNATLSDGLATNASVVTADDTFTVKVTEYDAKTNTYSYTITPESTGVEGAKQDFSVPPVAADTVGNPGSLGGLDVTIDSTKIKVGDSFTIVTRKEQNATGSKTNALQFQIGSNSNQTIGVGVDSMKTSDLHINKVDISTQAGATAAISTLDDAIKNVSAERSKLGAVQNRLEHTINNLGTSSENLTAAESRVRDVDMAKEMMEQTKNNILAQAAQAMLAQANQQPQGVLQLLR
ncbi:flagellin N-terminal helical domain-containing protein [Paenibacillus pini]|uniref:Flagellin n=1 Tax=Paenibacillus pini JCM 16418 TaxID=1236976 RepID=W7YU15_9BACL|nr:flagellin [Paenibacillus pini]GAF10693.1 flagellin protein FlaA [Paenibacillus pini JCM 16418]